jgi:hypothetical protein
MVCATPISVMVSVMGQIPLWNGVLLGKQRWPMRKNHDYRVHTYRGAKYLQLCALRFLLY